MSATYATAQKNSSPVCADPSKLDLVIRHAREFHDGHFYILSFTTGYKGGFETPDLDSGAGRNDILNLPAFESIDALLDHMLTPSCGCIRLTGGHV
jgi:hypothetical protein